LCVYCCAAIGSFVGSVALAKAGALAGAKVALVAFVSQYVLLRR
jgi:hypothetical protein